MSGSVRSQPVTLEFAATGSQTTACVPDTTTSSQKRHKMGTPRGPGLQGSDSASWCQQTPRAPRAPAASFFKALLGPVRLRCLSKWEQNSSEFTPQRTVPSCCSQAVKSRVPHSMEQRTGTCRPFFPAPFMLSLLQSTL